MRKVGAKLLSAFIGVAPTARSCFPDSEANLADPDAPYKAYLTSVACGLMWRNPVKVMTTSDSASYLTPQFDDFLFARIDDGSDAMPLSVLSVLARLGVDPWEEAAKLARLPRVSAAKRLVSFIAATPGAPSAYLNDKTVSDRLIALLPSPAGVVTPLRERGVSALIKSRSTTWLVVIALILTIQLIVLSRQSSVPTNEPQAISGTVRP